MKKLLCIAPLLFSAHSFAAPFGEPTNCREEVTSQKNIYQGVAECNAHYSWTDWANGKLKGFSDNKFISNDISPTTRQFVTVYDMVEIKSHTITGSAHNYHKQISCSAEVPFSHKEDVLETVCDYKPVAGIRVREDNEHVVDISVSGNDYDGNIVSLESWVNGVSKGSSKNYFHYHGSQKLINIKVRVVDNDGYQYTTSTNYRVTGNGGCNGEYC